MDDSLTDGMNEAVEEQSSPPTAPEPVQTEELSVDEVQVEKAPVEEVQVDEIQVDEVQVEEVQVDEVQAEKVPIEETPDTEPKTQETASLESEPLESGTPNLEQPAPTPSQIVEALLFSASQPLNPNRLANAADLEKAQVKEAVEALNQEYEQQQRSFQILEVANGYQLLTRAEFLPYIQNLGKVRAAEKLSQAALETLSIIAYKQPIIRADVEAIRGVQAGPIIRNLLERRLVCVKGRDARLGHPMLYGTTKRFLEIFGLKSIKDLPTLEEFK